MKTITKPTDKVQSTNSVTAKSIISTIFFLALFFSCLTTYSSIGIPTTDSAHTNSDSISFLKKGCGGRKKFRSCVKFSDRTTVWLELGDITLNLDDNKAEATSANPHTDENVPYSKQQIDPVKAVELYQVFPSQFSGTIAIRYFVPPSLDNAVLCIFNAAGYMVNEIPLKDFGNGQIEIPGYSLPPGQ